MKKFLLVIICSFFCCLAFTSQFYVGEGVTETKIICDEKDTFIYYIQKGQLKELKEDSNGYLYNNAIEIIEDFEYKSVSPIFINNSIKLLCYGWKDNNNKLFLLEKKQNTFSILNELSVINLHRLEGYTTYDSYVFTFIADSILYLLKTNSSFSEIRSISLENENVGSYEIEIDNNIVYGVYTNTDNQKNDLIYFKYDITTDDLIYNKLNYIAEITDLIYANENNSLLIYFQDEIEPLHVILNSEKEILKIDERIKTQETISVFYNNVLPEKPIVVEKKNSEYIISYESSSLNIPSFFEYEDFVFIPIEYTKGILLCKQKDSYNLIYEIDFEEKSIKQKDFMNKENIKLITVNYNKDLLLVFQNQDYLYFYKYGKDIELIYKYLNNSAPIKYEVFNKCNNYFGKSVLLKSNNFLIVGPGAVQLINLNTNELIKSFSDEIGITDIIEGKCSICEYKNHIINIKRY